MAKPIHRSAGLTFLYAICVLSISFTYCAFFIQVVQLPFQAHKFPDFVGPGWLYLLLIVIAQIEYSLWPLEVLNYLFRTYETQILLIIDPNNLNRWKNNSMIWGGVWTGIGFVGFSLYLSVPQFAEYIVSPLFYSITMVMYGFQNWMFYTYLVTVGDSDAYA